MRPSLSSTRVPPSRLEVERTSAYLRLPGPVSGTEALPARGGSREPRAGRLQPDTPAWGPRCRTAGKAPCHPPFTKSAGEPVIQSRWSEWDAHPPNYGFDYLFPADQADAGRRRGSRGATRAVSRGCQALNGTVAAWRARDSGAGSAMPRARSPATRGTPTYGAPSSASWQPGRPSGRSPWGSGSWPTETVVRQPSVWWACFGWPRPRSWPPCCRRWPIRGRRERVLILVSVLRGVATGAAAVVVGVADRRRSCMRWRCCRPSLPRSTDRRTPPCSRRSATPDTSSPAPMWSAGCWTPPPRWSVRCWQRCCCSSPA